MSTAPEPLPHYQFEAEFVSNGAVIGVDEAGRGPWAGPVSAAAFWINPLHKDRLPAMLTDSKKLSAKKRDTIRAELCNPVAGHVFAAFHVNAEQIDQLGLLPATFLAMREAVAAVEKMLHAKHKQIAHILVDGNLNPAWKWPSSAIVKGDSKSLSIAAASIIAKTSRDQIMKSLAADYPEYGWQDNAGYGTRAHQQALQDYGVTPFHRRSFAPIKKLLEKD